MALKRLYQSESWLRRKYLLERLSPEEIARICDSNVMTIYRYLDKYKIRGKR